MENNHGKESTYQAVSSFGNESINQMIDQQYTLYNDGESTDQKPSFSYYYDYCALDDFESLFGYHHLIFITTVLGIIFNCAIITIIAKRFGYERGKPLNKVHLQLIGLALYDLLVVVFLCLYRANIYMSFFGLWSDALGFVSHDILFTVAHTYNKFVTAYICAERVFAVWSLQTMMKINKKTKKRVVMEFVVLIPLVLVIGGSVYALQVAFPDSDVPHQAFHFTLMIIHVGLILVCSCIVLLKLRKQRKSKPQNHSSNTAKIQNNFHTLVATVGFIFCVCSISTGVLLCYELIWPQVYDKTFAILCMSHHFGISINSTVNIFVYFILLQQFRNVGIQMMTKSKRTLFWRRGSYQLNACPQDHVAQEEVSQNTNSTSA